MPKHPRLTADARRAAIVRAVLPVFAEKGPSGARTRDLAAAAGVSEALLYKHFPSKEALWSAIWEGHLADDQRHPDVAAAAAMPPSTGRLVRGIAALVAHMATAKRPLIARLMVHSLLEEGAFARTVYARAGAGWLGDLRESLLAAHAEGDLAELPDDDVDLWLCHHVALALTLVRFPRRTPVPYGLPATEVVTRTVHFCLRGLGLNDATIRRHLRGWTP